jgi:ABC-type Zn2+ transport system substrate-binding protein/surface adhesin
MVKATNFCCGKRRSTNFCPDCGKPMETQYQKLEKKYKTLKTKFDILYYDVYRYVENHYKKMAGSTVQYSIKDLEDVLEKTR